MLAKILFSTDIIFFSLTGIVNLFSFQSQAKVSFLFCHQNTFRRQNVPSIFFTWDEEK